MDTKLDFIPEMMLNPGRVYSREDLSLMTGLTDREIRRQISQAREIGIPIVPLPTGGYKFTIRNEDIADLLHLYKKRALKELYLYNCLKREMQIPGQLRIEEVME